MGGSTSSRSTIMSTSSSSSRLPDLVGGHSRNVSTASSRTSFSSTSGLSRNPSVASSSTSRRGYGFNVDTPIMEDDDEAEWLASDTTATGYGLPHPYECNMPPSIRMPVPTIRGQPAFGSGTGAGVPQTKRRPSHSQSGSRSLKKKLEPFGMGQDMRDVLEEIISMEKEFIIDSSDESSTHGYQSDTQPAVFTAVFDRPPRTPSPGNEGYKRASLVPGAPERGHRKSMSMANPPPEVQMGTIPHHPPPFIYGHSASLSESHTALYLATASPETDAQVRSASPPRMKARNSMSFTPEAAGPIIANPSWLGSDLTPSRRRPGHSPSAHHPTMSGWKFPNYANFNNASQSEVATPTRLTVDTSTLGNLRTPTSTSQRPHPNTRPQLLWPPNASQGPGLAPSHFPSSAGSRNSIISVNMDSTDDHIGSSPTVHMAQGQSQRQRPQRRRRQAPTPREVTPPDSGLRLGVLLGSGGSEEGGMDLDEGSPVLGGPGHYVNEHGFGYGFGTGRPVYLSPAPPDSVPHFR
jgi:hypothetical protein